MFAESDSTFIFVKGGPIFGFSEWSSTKIISLMSSGGDRCRIETTERKRVEWASLWYVIIIDVCGRTVKS